RVKPYAQKLEKNPDDAEANREMGKYLCLIKGQWARGLPLLAKGDDDALKGLAQKDLAKPADSKAQIALADAWFAYGESLKSGNTLAMARAYHWYGEALPGLEGGLTRARVLKQMEELAKFLPSQIITVRSADFAVETRRFETLHSGGVHCVAISADGRIAL